MGAASDASAWATKALALQGGHADALALMSQLHLERRYVGALNTPLVLTECWLLLFVNPPFLPSHRDYKQAHDTIKRLLEIKPSSDSRAGSSVVPHKDANHKDSYGKLAYGNLNLALAPSDRKKPEDAERAKEKLLKVSSSIFSSDI